MCFQECGSLTAVTASPQLNCIGSSAFWFCYNLSIVTLPVDVDTTDRFDGCAISTVYYTAGKTGVMPDRQTADPRANIPFRIPWNTRTGPR